MLHSYKHQKFTFKERRLIHRQALPTSAAEIKDQIVAVSELVATGAKEEAEKGLQGIRAGLDSIKDSLEVPELKEIYDNLSELSTKATGGSLDVLRQQIDDTRESIVPQVPAKPEEADAGADASVEEAGAEKEKKEEKKEEEKEPVWHKPNTWTEEQKSKAKVALGVGVVVIAGVLLFKALSDRTKKVANGVKEKASSAWGFVKTAAILGLLGVGTYFGVRGAMKLKESWDKVKEYEKKIRDVEKAMKKATGEQLTLLKAQHARMKRELEKLKNGEDEEEDEADEEDEPADDDSPESVPENAEEAFRLAEEALASEVIVRFFNDDSIEESEGTIKEWANDLIFTENKELPMRDVFKCITVNGDNIDIDVKDPFKVSGRDKESRTRVAGMILMYCQYHRDKVVDFIMRRDGKTKAEAESEMLDLPLEEYVTLACRSYQAMVSLLRRASEANGDVAAMIGGIDMKEVVNTDNGFMDAIGEYVAEDSGVSEEELEGITMGELTKAILNSRSGTVEVSAMHPPGPDAKPEEKIIHKIIETINTDDTWKYLMPFFHGEIPDFSGHENLSDEDKVKYFLREKMSVGRAVRLFLYRRMIDQGNATGFVLMQTEILKFVDEQQLGFWKDDKFKIMDKIAGKCMDSSAEEFNKQWEELDLDVEVPPEVMDMGWTASRAILSCSTKGAFEAFRQFASFMKAGYVRHPIMITGGYIGVNEAARAYKLRNVSPQAINSDLTRIAEKFRGRTGPIDESANWVRKMLPGVRTYDEIADADAAFEVITDARQVAHKARNVNAASNAKAKKLDVLIRKCVNKPHSRASWRKLADFLDTINPTAAAEARNFAKAGNRGWRAFVNARRICTASNLPLVRLFVGQVRLYDCGRQLAAPVLRATGRQIVRQAGNVARITRLNRLTRLMRLGRLGKVGRVLGPVGAIGLTGGEYVFYYKALKPQLEEMLKHETDPMKRRQIEREMSSQHVRMGANAVGSVCTLIPFPPVMIGGYAIIATSEAADALRTSIEDSTRYILQDESDLQGYSAGACLNEVGRSKSGKYATVGQAVAANPTLVSFLIPDNNLPILKHIGGMNESFMTANSVARWEAYSAYFAQSAAAQCESVSPMFLDDETIERVEKCENDDEANEMIERRLQTLNQDQTRMYVSAASRYIREKTNKTFDLKDAETMRRAEAYARLYVAEWRREMLDPESAKPFPLADDQKADEMIDKELVERESLVKAELDTLAKENPEEFKVTAVYHMLNSVSHEMALCEKKVISTNYSNVCSWTGWRRWASDEDYRQTARGVFAERVRKVAGNIDAGSWKASSYEKFRGELIASFRGKPNEMATEEIYNGRGKKYIEIGKDEYALTVHGVMGAV